MAMMSTQVTQQKESRALSEKLGATDLTRAIIAILSNTASCNALFAPTNLVNAGAIPFNATGISATNPYIFPLKAVQGGLGAPPVATAGTMISNLAPTLFPLNTGDTPAGIRMLITSLSTAAIEVNFDQTKLIRPIRNLQFPLKIVTAGPVGATTIVGCSVAGSAPLCITRQTAIPAGFGHNMGSACCLPTETLISGGATCANGSVNLSMPSATGPLPSATGGCWQAECNQDGSGGTPYGVSYAICCIY